MNSNQIIEARISDIKIGTRYRKEMGDIESLAESIKETELLQQIGITPDNKLIFGLRRLLAYRDVMRSETIPARIIDVQSVLHCQLAENTMRKDQTISERVAIVDALRSFKHGGDRRSKQARNGFVGGEDRRLAVPGHLYDEELQIDAGIGSLNTNGAQHVTNSLYVRMRNGGR